MFRNLGPYESYGAKPGKWIPAMPDHWQIAPGSSVLKAVAAKNTGSVESTVLSLSYGRVVIKPIEKLQGLTPESYETYQVLEPGDIVVRPTDLQNDKTSLRVGHVRDRGIITSAYLGFRASGVSNEYAFQYLATLDQMKVFYGMGSGLRQNLGSKDFKRLPVPVPPVEEQAAIGRYLRHAHVRIDRAIAVKRKLIALLEEQKHAVIRHAVTRGIDSTVPLKDSGIPWLDQIPVHWQVLRAKHLFTEFDQRSGTGLEPLLSLRAAAGLVYHDDVSVTPVPADVLARYKVIAPGQLVMNRMRAASGLFAVADVPGLVSPDYATLRIANDIVPRYYLRLFKTADAMAEFRRCSTGLGTGEAGFMRLYTEDFGRIALPVPPLVEQRAITEELDRETAQSGLAAAHALREIDLLREFRTRLTSDVVTGQLDVRQIASNLPELTEELLLDSRAEVEDTILEDAEGFLEEADV